MDENTGGSPNANICLRTQTVRSLRSLDNGNEQPEVPVRDDQTMNRETASILQGFSPIMCVGIRPPAAPFSTDPVYEYLHSWYAPELESCRQERMRRQIPADETKSDWELLVDHPIPDCQQRDAMYFFAQKVLPRVTEATVVVNEGEDVTRRSQDSDSHDGPDKRKKHKKNGREEQDLDPSPESKKPRTTKNNPSGETGGEKKESTGVIEAQCRLHTASSIIDDGVGDTSSFPPVLAEIVGHIPSAPLAPIPELPSVAAIPTPKRKVRFGKKVRRTVGCIVPRWRRNHRKDTTGGEAPPANLIHSPDSDTRTQNHPVQLPVAVLSTNPPPVTESKVDEIEAVHQPKTDNDELVSRWEIDCADEHSVDLSVLTMDWALLCGDSEVIPSIPTTIPTDKSIPVVVDGETVTVEEINELSSANQNTKSVMADLARQDETRDMNSLNSTIVSADDSEEFSVDRDTATGYVGVGYASSFPPVLAEIVGHIPSAPLAPIPELPSVAAIPTPKRKVRFGKKVRRTVGCIVPRWRRNHRKDTTGGEAPPANLIHSPDSDTRTQNHPVQLPVAVLSTNPPPVTESKVDEIEAVHQPKTDNDELVSRWEIDCADEHSVDLSVLTMDWALLCGDSEVIPSIPTTIPTDKSIPVVVDGETVTVEEINELSSANQNTKSVMADLARQDETRAMNSLSPSIVSASRKALRQSMVDFPEHDGIVPNVDSSRKKLLEMGQLSHTTTGLELERNKHNDGKNKDVHLQSDEAMQEDLVSSEGEQYLSIDEVGEKVSSLFAFLSFM